MAGCTMSVQPKEAAIQAMIVPTITAARPPGTPPGSLTLAVQLISTMPSETNAIHGTSHIWKAGRIEIKAIEMPASVPSMAARGVNLRIVGPINAPISTMTPMIKAQARPASQASMASLVFKKTGSMTTKTTMNMCGTLGP